MMVRDAILVSFIHEAAPEAEENNKDRGRC